MYGLGMYSAYGSYTVNFLGGTSVNVFITIAIRLLVGTGWYFLFKKVGKQGYWAFVPFVGPYMAFRMVCDDFSWSAIFSASTFLAWVTALGVDNVVIGAFAVINFFMWWAFALMSAHVFQTSMFFGFIYGAIPWFGALFFGLSSVPQYGKPISLLSKEEQDAQKKAEKKARKKARKKK